MGSRKASQPPPSDRTTRSSTPHGVTAQQLADQLAQQLRAQRAAAGPSADEPFTQDSISALPDVVPSSQLLLSQERHPTTPADRAAELAALRQEKEALLLRKEVDELRALIAARPSAGAHAFDGDMPPTGKTYPQAVLEAAQSTPGVLVEDVDAILQGRFRAARLCRLRKSIRDPLSQEETTARVDSSGVISMRPRNADAKQFGYDLLALLECLANFVALYTKFHGSTHVATVRAMLRFSSFLAAKGQTYSAAAVISYALARFDSNIADLHNPTGWSTQPDDWVRTYFDADTKRKAAPPEGAAPRKQRRDGDGGPKPWEAAGWDASVCWAFNEGQRGCQKASCKLRHICAKKGCSGKHASKDCSRA